VPSLTVRSSGAADWAALAALYPAAFPDEDLLPLVAALLRQPAEVLSLVACEGEAIVGHALFSVCSIVGSDCSAALLGPLAVTPAAQRKGIGSALIHDGLQRLEAEGVALVCVLGNPAYYGRFGFRAESAVQPPYAPPPESMPPEWQGAWQSLRLPGAEHRNCAGVLTVPPPWRDEVLWLP